MPPPCSVSSGLLHSIELSVSHFKYRGAWLKWSCTPKLMRCSVLSALWTQNTEYVWIQSRMQNMHVELRNLVNMLTLPLYGSPADIIFSFLWRCRGLKHLFQTPASMAIRCISISLSCVYFRFSKTDKGDDRCVPIGTVTQHLLEYAKELEMIV